MPTPRDGVIPALAGLPQDLCRPVKYAQKHPEWQGSALHAAVAARDLDRVKALAVGAALHQVDNFDATPLLLAVSPVVREPMAPRPTAALREAERKIQLEIVRELVSRGADPNKKGYHGTSPILRTTQMASTDEHTIRLLTLLLDAKADIDARDDRGSTALMEAVRANRLGVVRFLLERGANGGVIDCAGQTALDIATSMNAPALADILERAK